MPDSIFFIKALQNPTYKNSAWSGLLFGLAALVRPIIIGLPLLFAILLLIIKIFPTKYVPQIKFSLPLLIIFGYLVVTLPWIYSIYIHTGTFQPLSTGGPVAISAGLVMLTTPGDGGDALKLPKDVTALIEGLYTVNTNSIISLFKFLGKSLFLTPIAFLKLLLIKMARVWYATSELWWEKPILIVQVPYLLSALAGIIVLWKNFLQKKSRNAIFVNMLIATILYFWCVSALVLSILRYMIPIMGIMMIFSAFVLYLIYQTLYIRQKN